MMEQKLDIFLSLLIMLDFFIIEIICLFPLGSIYVIIVLYTYKDLS
jgi:hypothetical protein